VRGLRLADLDDETSAAVHARWLEHLVLFFPDQELTPAEHLAFARRFGDAEIHPFLPKLDDAYPEIVTIGADARADVFHTDVTFQSTPPLASALHARTMPAAGDTIFTNQYLAYECLAAPVRDLLGGLTAVHTAAIFVTPRSAPSTRSCGSIRDRAPVAVRQPSTHVAHPAAAALRERGPPRRAVLVLGGAAPAVPVPSGAGNPRVRDNRCTQHFAVNDDPVGVERRIERVTVLGDAPQGEPARWASYEPEQITAATTGYLEPTGPRSYAVTMDERQNSV
jgi:taurine dioxygenase